MNCEKQGKDYCRYRAGIGTLRIYREQIIR